MGSSSPPLTQGSGFFKHSVTPASKPKKKIYYEDLYGTRNEDEEFDRFPEACESEPDSDDEDDIQFSKSADYKRFFDGSYAGSSVRAPGVAQPSIALFTEMKTPGSEERYKISPKENSSRSVEVPSFEANGIFQELSSEEDAVEQETTTVAVDERRPKTSSRMPRPTTRRLFKQELAEQDKKRQKDNAERKREQKREIVEARRQEKAAVRRGKLSKEAAKSKHNTYKKAKLTGDLGGDEAHSEGVKKAYVMIDLTEIDEEEYERFSD